MSARVNLLHIDRAPTGSERACTVVTCNDEEQLWAKAELTYCDICTAPIACRGCALRALLRAVEESVGASMRVVCAGQIQVQGTRIQASRI